MEREGLAAPALFGLLAEFDKAEEVIAAARRTTEAGYSRVDAYSPFPVEGLAEAIGFRRSRIPLVVLIGGIVGLAVGYWLQYYTSAVDYPLNVGGRPLNSAPAFIPITFELTILFAALSAVIGMLALNGLPLPYHPVFNVERFLMASKDRFFLCIEARDPKFSTENTREFLESLGARGVYEIPR